MEELWGSSPASPVLVCDTETLSLLLPQSHLSRAGRHLLHLWDHKLVLSLRTMELKERGGEWGGGVIIVWIWRWQRMFSDSLSRCAHSVGLHINSDQIHLSRMTKTNHEKSWELSFFHIAEQTAGKWSVNIRSWWRQPPTPIRLWKGVWGGVYKDILPLNKQFWWSIPVFKDKKQNCMKKHIFFFHFSSAMFPSCH